MPSKFAVFRGSSDGRPVHPTNLHEAAEYGNEAYITRTVERTLELDINQRDRFSRTALMWAAEMGHVECAETLIEFGTDVTLAECNGRTAVHLAARAGDAKMLDTLLKHLTPEEKTAIVNTPDNFGITPVFLASQKMEEGQAAFEFLMSCGGKYK